MINELCIIPLKCAYSTSTHLPLLLAKAQPWSPLLHHHTGDTFGSFASCPTHHYVDIGVPAPADEGLETREREGTAGAAFESRP